MLSAFGSGSPCSLSTSGASAAAELARCSLQGRLRSDAVPEEAAGLFPLQAAKYTRYFTLDWMLDDSQLEMMAAQTSLVADEVFVVDQIEKPSDNKLFWAGEQQADGTTFS